MVGKLIIQTLVLYGLTAVLLFAAAGTWRWPQAWIFIIEMIATGIARAPVRDPTINASTMSRAKTMLPSEPLISRDAIGRDFGYRIGIRSGGRYDLPARRSSLKSTMAPITVNNAIASP